MKIHRLATFLAIGVAAVAIRTAIAVECQWDMFPDNCGDQPCSGIGCSITGYGPILFYCSPGENQNECCLCIWQTTTCACRFSTSNGVACDRISYSSDDGRHCDLIVPDGGIPGRGNCITQ